RSWCCGPYREGRRCFSAGSSHSSGESLKRKFRNRLGTEASVPNRFRNFRFSNLKLPDDLRVVLPKGLLLCQIRIDRLDFSIRIRDARNDGVVAGGESRPIVREELPRVGGVVMVEGGCFPWAIVDTHFDGFQRCAIVQGKTRRDILISI